MTGSKNDIYDVKAAEEEYDDEESKGSSGGETEIFKEEAKHGPLKKQTSFTEIKPIMDTRADSSPTERNSTMMRMNTRDRN